MRRGSFLYEGQGTERRWRSSLPQVPGMKEEEEVAVAWGGGAPIQAPDLPTAPAAFFSPPAHSAHHQATASPERLERWELLLLPQRSVTLSWDFNRNNDNNITR